MTGINQEEAMVVCKSGLIDIHSGFRGEEKLTVVIGAKSAF